MPAIQQVYDEYRDRGFEVVGVDFQEPAEDAAAFVQRGGFSWHFVLDSKGLVAKEYNVLGLPTSLLIDRQGIVRRIQVGPFLSKEDLSQKVDGVIGQPSASASSAQNTAALATRP
jgi:peroxiredoxin